MEQLQEETKTTKRARKRVISNKATVLKDRRADEQSLTGQVFANPTYKTFLPHISALALGQGHHGVDTSRNSASIIDGERNRETDRLQKEIVLEEIQGLMIAHHPGQSADDKKAKAGLLVKHFGTRSWVECEKQMSLDMLRAGYDSLHVELEGRPSRYHQHKITPRSTVEDDIPDFNGTSLPERIPATHAAVRAD
jgi:hypothetical protein